MQQTGGRTTFSERGYSVVHGRPFIARTRAWEPGRYESQSTFLVLVFLLFREPSATAQPSPAQPSHSPFCESVGSWRLHLRPACLSGRRFTSIYLSSASQHSTSLRMPHPRRLSHASPFLPPLTPPRLPPLPHPAPQPQRPPRPSRASTTRPRTSHAGPPDTTCPTQPRLRPAPPPRRPRSSVARQGPVLASTRLRTPVPCHPSRPVLRPPCCAALRVPRRCSGASGARSADPGSLARHSAEERGGG